MCRFKSSWEGGGKRETDRDRELSGHMAVAQLFFLDCHSNLASNRTATQIIITSREGNDTLYAIEIYFLYGVSIAMGPPAVLKKDLKDLGLHLRGPWSP